MTQKPTLPNGVTGERKDSYKSIANRLFANANAIRRVRELTSQEALQAFSEGDEVDTPAGVGVVVEIRTEGFTGPDDEDVEASEDTPAYVVAVEDGARVYRESELEAGEIEADVDQPEEALRVYGDLAGDTEALQDDGRTFDYPESWRESETPARVILLKAWAGLGGRFTTCRREMAGEVASPARFCASMKDSVLQWEGWRQ